MTIAKQKARDFLRNLKKTNDGDIMFPAFMGNRSGVVRADKKNNVYVVDYRGVVHKVKNFNGIPNVAKLPVLVGRDKSNPKFLQVLRMRDVYIDPPYPAVAEHAEIMHTRWGYDPVFVISGQILPGLATPSRTVAMVMQLRGFPYYLDGWHLLDNTDIDFSGEIPASGANWVVAEIDSAKVITLRAGVTVVSRSELRPEDIPTVSADKKSLFAIKCYFGQTRIIDTKIDSDYFDMRFTGIASGGIATSVSWDDVVGKPTVFPPDLDITDLIYIRKWLKLVDPGNNDDVTTGYEVLDHWINTTTGDIFTCADNTDGLAVWTPNGSGGGAGNAVGLSGFAVDGVLAVVDEATTPILITADTTNSLWKLYLRNLGTSGSSIFDVILKRVGEADVSIFNDGITDNRPEIQWNDTDHLLDATPLIVDFLAGDVLELNIDQIAVDAADAVLLPVGVASLSSLEVTDGITTVLHANKISVEGSVTDMGGGEARISGLLISYSTVQTRTQATFTVAPTVDEEITQLAIVMTPRKAGNKIILEWHIKGESDWDVGFVVYRNGTILANSSDVDNHGYAVITQNQYDTDLNSTPTNSVVRIVDEDSLDVETTYSVYLRATHSTTSTFYLNRTVTSTGTSGYESMLSSGTAMEINT